MFVYFSLWPGGIFYSLRRRRHTGSFLAHVQGIERSDEEGQCERCLSHLAFSSERDQGPLQTRQHFGKLSRRHVGLMKRDDSKPGASGYQNKSPRSQRARRGGAEGATPVRVQAQEDVPGLRRGRWAGAGGDRVRASSGSLQVSEPPPGDWV